MNNYLLESSDHLLLQEEIKNIIKKENYLEEYQATYDLEETLLENALEDLDTYSFFSDKKVIIIKNILSSFATDKEKEHLLRYIENYNSTNLLIMTADKMDAKTFSKKLKSSKNIVYKKLEIDALEYCKNKLKDYQINREDLLYLIDLCKNDMTKIDSECEKLMMYKVKEKEITRKDLDDLVVKKLGDSNEILYSLVNSIMSKNKKLSLKAYQELKEYQIDSNSVIGLMTSQMKLISQIKVLKEDNLSNAEIQQKLNLKSIYQVKKLGEYIYQYSYKEIGIFFQKLSDIDVKIKSGKMDSNDAIELLIISL